MLAATTVVLLTVARAGAQTPMPMASRAPVAPIHIQVTPATFTGPQRKTVTVQEEDGKTATYSGVYLDDVLVAAGAPNGMAVRGAAVATYVVIRASDGYRAVFSLAEVDPAFTDNVILLADQRNGVALPSEIGPYRIIVPAEHRHARWIRSVTEIDVQPAP
jgi:hypothetical protein